MGLGRLQAWTETNITMINVNVKKFLVMILSKVMFSDSIMTCFETGVV